MIVVLALSGIVLPYLFPTGVAAPIYRSGLKPGDSAFYDLAGTYGFSSGQPVTQMSVISVVGTNITASFSGFSPDGPSASNEYWIDVFSGQVRNASSNLFFAASPGLLIADPIFNGVGVEITSQQVTMCGSATRQMVSVQFTRSYQHVAVGWDQNTGALCKLTLNDQSSTRNLSMTMKNTTLWGPDSSSTDPFASLVTVANITAALGLPLVALILFVYIRGARTRKTRRSK